MFYQIWLLALIVNVLMHIKSKPFVEICIFDREIRKINMLHVYTPNLNVLCSTNIPSRKKYVGCTATQLHVQFAALDSLWYIYGAEILLNGHQALTATQQAKATSTMCFHCE